MIPNKAANINAKLVKLAQRKNDLQEQKYIDLDTTFERMKLKANIAESFEPLVAKLTDLLAEPHTWDNANTIEQLLTPLYSDIELDSEIELNLLDAKQRLSAAGTQFFYDQFKMVDDRDGKINLLCNLYKKLQVSYDHEEQKKHLLSVMRFTTSVAFFMSIMMFFLFDNLRFIKMMMSVDSTDKFEFVVAALSAGWMGACFSMLLGLKGDTSNQSLAHLTATSRIDNLVARSLIGSVSGLLIMFAFAATILQGALFPTLSFDGAGKFVSDTAGWDMSKAHAMLVFWCFLAGFSEKLVPDLLAKAEESAMEDKKK